MRLKSFDGLALTPAYMAEDDAPLEFTSTLQSLMGQAGAFDAGGDEQVRSPLTITRSVLLVNTTGADAADVGAQLDELRKRANKGLRWLVMKTNSGEERGTWAKLKRVQAKFKPDVKTILPVQLTFEVPWPWLEDLRDIWYLDAGHELDEGLALDANYAEQVGAGSFTIDNAGGDQVTRGLIEIEGPSTAPTVTNNTTGETINYSGTIPSGSTLLIDLGAQSAKLNGADAWGGITIGDEQTRLFSLATGENAISFTGGGTLRIHWARVY